jgi:hypothetical protein
MIPEKLYIPTSTLNFNNIMSSESISPASFYTRRGFGYKRFEKVGPNNLENYLILYDKYPTFSIPDKDLENYPMIIEIDTKYVNEDIIQKYKDGVYYTEETIYLNPFTTKIFFNNEEERRNTISTSESSIETKMVSIYKKCFYVKSNDNIESFKWEKTELKDSTVDNSMHISKDRKINKLKGFMYAYIIAANKSLSTEVVALKKDAKELRNTLSAVITSPDGRATDKQEKQLNALYKAINNVFYKAEGIEKKQQEIIKQKIEHYGEKFIEIIREEGLYDFWLQKQNLKPSFQISSFSFYQADKEKIFEDYILRLDNANNKVAVPIFIQKEQFPVLLHCSRIESIPAQNNEFNSDFLPKLLNEYLEEAYNSEEFVQSRYEFAKSGGKIFNPTWVKPPQKTQKMG